MQTTEDTDLDRALHLADVADEVTRTYYLSSRLIIDTKPDASPVTQADRETEEALRKIVQSYGDAYIGEEGARQKADSGRWWIVDPIDGTRNFLRGMPVWSTLIALSDQDGPLVSVVTAPALGRRWWAVRGAGAFTRDVDGTVRQIKASKVAKLEDAYLSQGSLFTWDTIPTGSATVLALMKQSWRQRAIGDFLNYMLVAEGAIDACFEADPKQWDIEAPALIVTEAGGSFWMSAGRDQPAETKRVVVATNGLLEDAILTGLRLR